MDSSSSPTTDRSRVVPPSQPPLANTPPQPPSTNNQPRIFVDPSISHIAQQPATSPPPFPQAVPATTPVQQPAATSSPVAQSSPAVRRATVPPISERDILKKAAFDDRKRRLINGIRGLFSFIMFIGTVVVASVLINHFIFQAYYVDGSSMAPTLENNDRLIVDKISKTIDSLMGKQYTPSRGDIITFDSDLHGSSGSSDQLIKRVIGLPGDTVSIKDGKVTIKNKAYPDGFDPDAKLGLKLESTDIEAPYEQVVPEGAVFVMGDNRGPNGSYDSRSFGPVPIDRLQGRLALRIFPFDAWRTF